MQVGQYGTSLILNLGIDITGIISYAIRIKRYNSTLIDRSSLDIGQNYLYIIQNNPGQIKYIIQNTDLSMAGIYKIQTFLRFNDSSRNEGLVSDIVSFTVDPLLGTMIPSIFGL